MFSSKKLAVLVIHFVTGPSDAQYLAASPYYYPSAYSPLAYSSIYSGYAAYPAFYGWGSNKGASGDKTAENGGNLTNNQ